MSVSQSAFICQVNAYNQNCSNYLPLIHITTQYRKIAKISMVKR